MTIKRKYGKKAMKTLVIFLVILSHVCYAKQTNDEERDLILIKIKKSETAPYTGILMPVTEYNEYESAQRRIDYIVEHPVICEEPSDSSWPPIIFGLLIGGLAGFSFNH